MTMTLAKPAIARPLPRSRAARHRGGRLRHRAPRHRPYPRPLARAARNRHHRGSRRRQRHRPASSVPPLVRADAEGLPAGAHAQPRARTAALVGERAGDLLRGRPVRPRPAARSVRHARGDVAGRMEGRRRRPHHQLRLPSLPVRHGAGDDHAARPGRPRARRRRQGTRGAQGHARALAEGALCRGLRGHRADRAPHLRSDAVEPRAAAARGADRHGFRSARVGEAAHHSDGRAHHLFRSRRQSRLAEGRARGRRRGRQESDLLRGAVPSRHRQERRHHRLSLGPHAQARDARLGSGKVAA